MEEARMQMYFYNEWGWDQSLRVAGQYAYILAPNVGMLPEWYQNPLTEGWVHNFVFEFISMHKLVFKYIVCVSKSKLTSTLCFRMCKMPGAC